MKRNYKSLVTALGTLIIFALSMPDRFLELYREFMHSGLTPAFVVAIAIWTSKEIRNKRLDRRDVRWERKLNSIMTAVGAEETSYTGAVANLKPLSLLFWKADLKKKSNYSRRKTKMIATILKANLSKKLISAIVCIGVVSLNNKFNLNISPDYVYGILGLSALHISLQTIIDAIKAWSLSKVSAAVTEVSKAPIGLQPTDAPPMTYDELKPIMNTVNTALNKFNDDLRSGKMTDTTKDAINAYVAINDYLNQKGA